MSKNKLKLEAGSVFAVPIQSGGYAIGFVSRITDSIALGYFFKEKYEKLPNLKEVSQLFYTGHNIAFIKKFGTLALYNRRWPILGTLLNWDQDDWPIPKFLKVDLLTNEKFIMYYDNQLKFIRQEQISDNDENSNLPEDGVAGYGFIEKRLSKLML